MATLGIKIRKLRELKNIKQDHMAEALGISQSAYSRIEKDESEVSHERLVQIAKVLDLEVQDILGFDEKQVFNYINSNGSHSQGVINNPNHTAFSENEKKLYEDKVKLLEENIKMKDEMIAMLKEEVERLKRK